MFLNVVTDLSKGTFQLFIAGPWSHVNHVLKNEPPGPKRPGILDNKHCSCSASLVAWCCPFGAGMVRTLRRRKQQVDFTDPLFQDAEAYIFKAIGYDLSIREVCGKGFRGYGAHVDTSRHLYTGGSCSSAATSSAAKHVKTTDQSRKPSSRLIIGTAKFQNYDYT